MSAVAEHTAVDAREMAIASLLDAGRGIAISVGFERLRMGNVAWKAEVSRASLYRYFASKEAFIAALLVREMEAVKAETVCGFIEAVNSSPLFDCAREIESVSLLRATVFSRQLINAVPAELDPYSTDAAMLRWFMGRRA